MLSLGSGGGMEFSGLSGAVDVLGGGGDLAANSGNSAADRTFLIDGSRVWRSLPVPRILGVGLWLRSRSLRYAGLRELLRAGTGNGGPGCLLVLPVLLVRSLTMLGERARFRELE